MCHKRLFSLAKLLSKTPETAASPMTAAGDSATSLCERSSVLSNGAAAACGLIRGFLQSSVSPRLRRMRDARDARATRCDEA